MKTTRAAFSLVALPLAAMLSVSTPAAAQDGPGHGPAHTAELGGCEVVTLLDDGPPPVPAPAGAPLSLAITFDSNVSTAQRAVCLQAVADWQAVVESNGQMASPYPIHFENGPLGTTPSGGNILAQASTFSNTSNGMLVSSTIRIDDDGTSSFFVDPTPGDSSEFDPFGNCTNASVCGNFDLLTVMRHELGHALGWVGFFSSNGNPPNVLPGALMSGTTFDPSRLNVPCDPTPTSHSSSTVFPGGLMNPGLAAGTRIGVANYPDLAVIGRAFQHGVRLRFIDSSAGSTGAGSASSPYASFASAEANAPAGYTIVVANGSYSASNLFLSTSHVYLGVWNGVSVLE